MLSEPMINLIFFVLSCLIGYFVIWGVTPALHTPLMAVTNAMSAIVIVGAILVVGEHPFSLDLEFKWQTVLGFCAVLCAAINVFGGFVVTHRMLMMFQQKKKDRST